VREFKRRFLDAVPILLGDQQFTAEDPAADTATPLGGTDAGMGLAGLEPWVPPSTPIGTG
jgi:hypothetical protein